MSVVPFVVVYGVFSHALHDGLLQLGCLEQSRSVRYARKCLVRLEHFSGHAHVDVFARLDVHSQPSQHNGDQASGAGARDEVEMFAWFRDFVSFRSPSFSLDKGSVHELLQYNEHGVAAHASAI